MDLTKLSIFELKKGLQTKQFSSVELITAYQKNIEQQADLNAFISLNDQALDTAKKIDQEINNNIFKTLSGIPFSVKDSIITEDLRSTAGAKILDNYLPPFEATIIDRLKKNGAIIIGKTNCDAFGHGATNENSMYGPVKNPYDQTRVSGGSSGGSAVSVAANMCAFSIAEDTGGSIRQPSAFCGVVGLRPSYGLVSRYGIMPMASSLDIAGPMTKKVKDLALILEIIAGQDNKDFTSLKTETNYLDKIEEKQTYTLGIATDYFEHEGLDNEVGDKLNNFIKEIEKQGFKTKTINLPYSKYGIAVYYIIVPSEDSSNLARLDGLRYGQQIKGDNLDQTYKLSRQQGFPDEVKRRIMIGAYCLSAGYYDAYFTQAQKVRTLIIQDFQNAFQDVDFILTPTAPTTALKLNEVNNNPLSAYLSDLFVSPSALAGLPAISLPVTYSNNNLPIGLQIIGPRLSEKRLLNLAYQIEQIYG